MVEIVHNVGGVPGSPGKSVSVCRSRGKSRQPVVFEKVVWNYTKMSELFCLKPYKNVWN
jgi:hypothetical protein